MKATMTMRAEPLFGGQVEFSVEAEVDNARMLNNYSLFSQMARMLGHMNDELQAESERAILAEAGDGTEGMRLAHQRERVEQERRNRDTAGDDRG